MKVNMPKVPDEMQNMSKAVTLLQLIGFLAIFLTIYLLLRQIVHSTLLRVLILIADYMVSALISYCWIRPAAMKLDAKRKQK